MPESRSRSLPSGLRMACGGSGLVSCHDVQASMQRKALAGVVYIAEAHQVHAAQRLSTCSLKEPQRARQTTKDRADPPCCNMSLVNKPQTMHTAVTQHAESWLRGGQHLPVLSPAYAAADPRNTIPSTLDPRP